MTISGQLGATGASREPFATAATPMTRFLAAALGDAEPGSERLRREIERINPAKSLDIPEVIAASARIGHETLRRNRYDAAVTWPPDDAGGFVMSALNAAPTGTLRAFLSNPPSAIAEWLDRPGTMITYLGVDFDQRRYKLYLFRDGGPALRDAGTLETVAQALHRSAYIDCLEFDMETAAYARSAYWKLDIVSFPDSLAASYRPHPDIENRILRVDGRTRVVSALEAIAGERHNAPIIKFRRPRGIWSTPDAPQLARSPYAIEWSLFDAGRLKYVNAYSEEILTIASVFSCRAPVARWLKAIRRFGCYIHYIGVGDDFVTFYYQCCTSAQEAV